MSEPTVTTYAVGATFRIVDEATPALKVISDALAKLDGVTKALQDKLGLVGQFKFTALEGVLGSLGVKFDDVTKQIGGTQIKLQEVADTRFGGLNRGLTGVATRLDTIEARAKAATTALGSMPALPSPGGGGGGRHIRPGQAAHEGEGSGHANAYGRHGVGVDAGVFGFMGFEAIKGGVESTLHRGMELAHVQQQMLQGGMEQAEVDRATQAAWTESRAYGLDVTKVLGDIKELRFPFGSTEHAINFIDPLEKMRVVLNAVSEGRGNETADSVYQMARAGELKGLQKPEDFVSYFDQMTKVVSATGGKVTPKDFMQAMKYGRLASLGWNEDFTTKYLPSLMQSLGPSGAGTAAMSLFGTLAEGQVGKRSLEQMQDIGLISDPSKIIYNKIGPAGFKPGAIAGTDQLVSNPALWAQNVLLPLLTQKFGDLTLDKNRETAAANLGGMFGNRMSAQAIGEFILRMQSINKDVGQLGPAKGFGGAADLLKNDPSTAMNNFSAAWTNLLTALGGPAVKPAADMLNGLSAGINRIGEFAQSHPTLAKDLEGLAGGLAVGLGALAAVGLAAFLPGSGFVIAMATIGPALAGLAAVNWDAIKAAVGKIPAVVDEVTSLFATLADKVSAAIHGFIAGILAKLQAIPGIGHFFGTDADTGLAHKTAFETSGSDNPFTIAVRDGFLQAFAQLSGRDLSGLGGAGAGGGGFTNASFESFDANSGGHFGRGSGGGGFTGNPGTPGWWTSDKQSHAVSALMAGGVSQLGAEALVSRWANVESHGGPQSINPNSGAIGIGQWLGDRKIGVTGDFDDQLRHVLKELHGSESRALGLLNSGSSAGAATGASQFERAEGYNPRTGVDNFTNRTLQGMGRVHANVGAPPRRSSPFSPFSGGGSVGPVEIVLHNHTHLDGRKIKHDVVRQIVADARYGRSKGGFDSHGHWAAPGDTLTDAG